MSSWTLRGRLHRASFEALGVQPALGLARAACGARPSRLAAVGLCLALGCVACTKHPDDAAPPPERSAATAGPPELASDTAFDLTPAPTGALLAWAGRGQGRVELERLDGAGRTQRGSRQARAPSTGAHVADLVAVATDAGVAVAWSEANEGTGGLATVMAAWVPPDGVAQTHPLGSASRPPVPGRGDLALAARGDGALVFARGTETACVDAADEPCVAFNFFQLSGDGVAPAGLSLSVPSPCDARAAQLSLEGRAPGAAPGSFDYAVCSNARGASALTIFSIRTNPAYAASREAFAGCTPLGAARFAGQATFVATCGQHRRMTTADVREGELAEQDIDERGLICKGGVALIRFGASWLRLEQPIGSLELLLGEDLSPPGSRAVWTGQALVVARALDGRLRLGRYGCRDSSVVELSVDGDAGL